MPPCLTDDLPNEILLYILDSTTLTHVDARTIQVINHKFYDLTETTCFWIRIARGTSAVIEDHQFLRTDLSPQELRNMIKISVERRTVKHWRHLLQRSFLHPQLQLTLEDTPAMDRLFAKVEAFDNMSVEHLAYSKIGKVIRRVAIADPPPAGDEEYRFRQRSKTLIDKWTLIISNSNAPAPGST